MILLLFLLCESELLLLLLLLCCHYVVDGMKLPFHFQYCVPAAFAAEPDERYVRETPVP